MNGGFIYTPKDERDYPVCMAYDDGDDIAVPERFTTSFQPPYEKQLCGNCVAQSLANIMEVMYHNVTKRHEDFSVGFIYGNRDENEDKSEGMTGYLACGHLVKDGDVKSEVFDNPGSAPSIIKVVNEFKEKNPNWRENAYVPTSYIRTENADEVKKFILKYNIPVMAICRVNDFYWGGGLHAMALYGWNGDTAIMQNSWGERSTQKIVELEFEKIVECWMILPFDLGNFSDLTEEHWAYKDISRCAEDGIMLGYPNGEFQPENQITRAEFAAAIYRLLKKKGR